MCNSKQFQNSYGYGYLVNTTIGIGGSRFVLLLPCHTTGQTVRLRRFGWVRLRSEFRHSHPVVVARRQRGVKQLGGVAPPASRVRCPCRAASSLAPRRFISRYMVVPHFHCLSCTSCCRCRIYSSSFADDARRVCQPAVGLPADDVAAQRRGSACSDPRVGP